MIENWDGLKYHQYQTVREKVNKLQMINTPIFMNKSIFRYLRDVQDPAYKDAYMTPSENKYRQKIIGNIIIVEIQ